MKKSKFLLVALCAAFLLSASNIVAEEAGKPRLILIGDSTVKNGSGRGDGGLWGWGQVFAEQFDTTRIDIENHAIGGRSSRTFLTEGRWDTRARAAQAG